MSNKDKRRRMNTILDICKFRKDKKAIQCFDDDCQDIKEEVLISKKIRRRGDGTMDTIETKTGNYHIWCDTHGWSGLFGQNQLDGLNMPERTTSVSDAVPVIDNPESNVIER